MSIQLIQHMYFHTKFINEKIIIFMMMGWRIEKFCLKTAIKYNLIC